MHMWRDGRQRKRVTFLQHAMKERTQDAVVALQHLAVSSDLQLLVLVCNDQGGVQATEGLLQAPVLGKVDRSTKELLWVFICACF